MDAGKRRQKLTAIEVLMMERGSPLRETKAPSPDVSPEQELDSDRNSGQHSLPVSLHVNYTADDIERMAKEIFEGTVSEVELSLLGWWICESNEHYELAKSFIRELSLDQGYNVARIENQSLRTLLIYTKAARPVEAKSKAFKLPWQLRQQRARNMKESERASPASTPMKDSPPNTPDRPSPLMIKSRHSDKSSITPSTGSRSVSAPVTRNKRSDTTPFPRNSHILEETESHPLLAAHTPLSTEFGGRAEADDVFGIPENEASRGAEPVSPVHVFDESRLRALNQLQGTAEVSYQYQQRIYELSHSELSSTTSDEATEGLRLLSIDKEITETSPTQLTQFQGNSALEATYGHQTGLNRDSTTTSDVDSNRHTNNYASSNAASDPFEYDQGTFRHGLGLPRYQLERHTPNDSADPYLRPLPQRKHQSGETGGALGASSYLRPLPLRRYQSNGSQPLSPSPRPLAARDHESGEQLQSAGGLRSRQSRNDQSDEPQATPSRRPLPLRTYGSKASLTSTPTPNLPSKIPRLTTAGSMVRNHRPTRLAMPTFQTPSRSSCNASDRTSHQESPLSRRQEATRSSQPIQLPVHATNARISTPSLNEAVNRHSISDMLEHFPTPPSQTPAVAPTASDSTPPISALAKACRLSTTTSAMIQEMLETTRAHGETLPVMDWKSMSAPERSWRENNEMLLIVIYGRQDTELSDEDVANVDAVAQHLVLERGRWLLDVFRAEAPIF